ncbi:PTS sugar transporter subunit IIB [Enterococcus sp. LJL120]
MENVNILLCCGAGMSSGFLAQKTRKAAKKRGLTATVEARSESEVAQYLPTIDVLLLGPHYAAFKDEMAETARPHNVVVNVIPQDIYGMLDGDGLLDFALAQLATAKS